MAERNDDKFLLQFVFDFFERYEEIACLHKRIKEKFLKYTIVINLSEFIADQ